VATQTRVRTAAARGLTAAVVAIAVRRTGRTGRDTVAAAGTHDDALRGLSTQKQRIGMACPGALNPW
jgi:hypothetical protein